MLQRQGFYDPPPGVVPYPGLECPGGSRARRRGRRLVASATRCARCWRAAVTRSRSRPGRAAAAGARGRRPGGGGRAARGGLHGLVERLHDRPPAPGRDAAGARRLVSGIGTMAIQLGQGGRRPGRGDGGHARRSSTRCAELGADVLINYREQDFVEEVREATGGAGADVILDNMGAKYLERNVDALAVNGRLVDHRPAGRGQGRAEPRRAAAKRAAVHRDLAAGPAAGGEGGDRGRRARARLAAGRGRSGPAGRAPGAPDGRRGGGHRWWRRAATWARCCCSPEWPGVLGPGGILGTAQGSCASRRRVRRTPDVPYPGTRTESNPVSPIASYRRLFALAGPLYVVTAFLGRLPLAMSQMGALLLVSSATGSYAAGGLAAGALAVANAVCSPVAGALADRRRPAPRGARAVRPRRTRRSPRSSPWPPQGPARRAGRGRRCRGRPGAADRAAGPGAVAPDHPGQRPPPAAPGGGGVLLRGRGRRGLLRARPGPARHPRGGGRTRGRRC